MTKTATANLASFNATLLRPKVAKGEAPTDWLFLLLPDDVSQALPSRGLVTVDGTINKTPLQATLKPDGKGGHWLRVEPDLLKRVKLTAGDTATLAIQPVAEEPEPPVPGDLRDALAASPEASAMWSDITPIARRDWIFWMTSGKRAATRDTRRATMLDMLAKGKRRACCFDRSGLYSNSLSRPLAEGE